MTPMTVEGAELLREELQHLKNVLRPSISKAIGAAREMGDLRENAEYHAAKERQAFTEARIRHIEVRLADARIIDVTKIRASGKVVFGTTVTLFDVQNEAEVRYKIVGEDEADLKVNKLSVMSPLAKAVIGKGEGDSAMVDTPTGKREYEIEAIAYI